MLDQLDPPSRVRRLGRVLAVLAVGVLLGLGTVWIANGGVLFVSPAAARGTVTLDGVQVNYFYANGTPQIYGPNEQEGCANCPLTVSGGGQLWLSNIFSGYGIANKTVNFTVYVASSIPFEEDDCSSSQPITHCPYVTSWTDGGWTIDCDPGFTVTYPLILEVPSTVPNFPGGITVQWDVNVSVGPCFSFSGATSGAAR